MINPQPSIINAWEHQGWGDAISFLDCARQRLTGHLTPLPREGDEVRFQMQTGKIGRFKIVKMEPCRDPADMFFATVTLEGYAVIPEKRNGLTTLRETL